MKVNSIEKVDNANQLEITLEIGPSNLSFWDSVNFSSMVVLTDMNGFNDYTVRRNNDGTVTIFANYNTDIQNREITVKLDPTLSGNAVLSRAAPM